jgi:hypothetical protein
MHKALLWRYKLVDRKAPVHRLVPLPAIQAFVARLGGWLVKNSDAVELAYVALRTTPVLWDFLKALQTETSLDPMVCEEWATLCMSRSSPDSLHVTMYAHPRKSNAAA